ncbi:hypothetical protein PF001_g11246, partial [Phytophthora fragariae]
MTLERGPGSSAVAKKLETEKRRPGPLVVAKKLETEERRPRSSVVAKKLEMEERRLMSSVVAKKLEMKDGGSVRRMIETVRKKTVRNTWRKTRVKMRRKKAVRKSRRTLHLKMDRDTEAPPNFHRSRAGEKKTSALSHFKNFPAIFGSWQDFHEVFQAYQVKTYQHFSKRTSTSVTVRNNQIKRAALRLKRQGKKQRKKEQFLPEEWGQYSKTLVCTHGQPYHSRGKGRRKHEK